MPSFHMHRRLIIVAAVIGFHVLGLWALQSGLLRRAVELVVPVSVMASLVEPPQPQSAPKPELPKPLPVTKTVTPPVRKTAPPPMPLAISDPTPAPEAPAGVIAAAPPEPLPPPSAPVTPAPAAPPAPPKVELPSSTADYLDNRLPYPAMSRRLRETGTVGVRAYVEANGTASRVELRTSSGFGRLDQAALDAVLKWKFVPGKRGGVPEATWVSLSIRFELDD